MSHSEINTDDFLAAVEEKVTRRSGEFHSWKDAFHLLSRSLRAPHKVGSLWPSSRYLARYMLQGVPLKSGDVVVEYGPGTGPFTHFLKYYVEQGVSYLGIEQDRVLYEKLRRRFPQLRFHHGSAEEVKQLLPYYQLEKPSLVISGLPFANMPAAIQEAILQVTQEVLRDDGFFRTFTYLFSSISPRALQFKKIVLNKFLQQHQSKIVFSNLPPARVLSFSHPRREE